MCVRVLKCEGAEDGARIGRNLGRKEEEYLVFGKHVLTEKADLVDDNSNDCSDDEVMDDMNACEERIMDTSRKPKGQEYCDYVV